MSTPRYARIAITIPPEDLEAADVLAKASDRSRSWIIAEAVRQYVHERGRQSAAGELGRSRQAQVGRDLRLTAQERISDAEAQDVAVLEVASTRTVEQPRVFGSYDEFVSWRSRRSAE